MKTKSSILSLIILLAASLPSTAQNPGDRVFKEVTENGKKVIKELLYDSVTEYNEDGKEIYTAFFFPLKPFKYEDWIEYDNKGNITHKKHSSGYEEWYKYNSNGNKSYEKNSAGEEICYEYDQNGKLIHEKHPNDYEKWYEYDSKGNIIHGKSSGNYEQWNEYGQNGKLIYKKMIYESEEAYSIETWYEYDSKGNITHEKNSDDEETWYEYKFHPNGKLKFKKTYTSL